MTTSLDLRQATAALRRAAVRATLAPSVHNTQPWRFQLRTRTISPSAPIVTRQLRVLDPTGRQLMISCGCALFNARVVARRRRVRRRRRAAAGPDPTSRTARAAIGSAVHRTATAGPIAALDNVIELRQTNRRHSPRTTSRPRSIDTLERAAEAEAQPAVRGAQRGSSAGGRAAEPAGRRDPEPQSGLSRRAPGLDHQRSGPPGRRADLGRPARRRQRARRGPDPRLRHAAASGWLPAETQLVAQPVPAPARHQRRHPAAWLRAGEALERMLLEVTRHGFAASPLTQVIEVPATRAALRSRTRPARCIRTCCCASAGRRRRRRPGVAGWSTCSVTAA